MTHRKIISDFNSTKFSYNFSDIENMIDGFPNITPTAQPFDIYKVQYLFREKKFSLARKYIESSNSINPHVFISEYLTGLFYLKVFLLDSAFVYSKKAFEGWPKHFPHYELYLDVLKSKKDTTLLVDAFNYLNIEQKRDPNYFKKFYSVLNEVKLSYLITDYPDSRNVLISDLIGSKFERGYNFPNNQVISDSTIRYSFISNKIFQNSNGSEYSYSIKMDTLYFYYKNNLNKPFQKFKSQFSPKFNTLIFKNVKIEDGKYQDQFFIKHD